MNKLRANRQMDSKTGTGNYNPNPEFDYPLPAIMLTNHQEIVGNKEDLKWDATGIDTSDMNQDLKFIKHIKMLSQIKFKIIIQT